jgi:hypothetical protein
VGIAYPHKILYDGVDNGEVYLDVSHFALLGQVLNRIRQSLLPVVNSYERAPEDTPGVVEPHLNYNEDPVISARCS